MNGKEYRAIIERLGMSQVGAARFLGVADSTSRRWIADTHPIPNAVAMLLCVMARYRLTAQTVASLMAKEAKRR